MADVVNNTPQSIIFEETLRGVLSKTQQNPLWNMLRNAMGVPGPNEMSDTNEVPPSPTLLPWPEMDPDIYLNMEQIKSFPMCL